MQNVSNQTCDATCQDEVLEIFRTEAAMDNIPVISFLTFTMVFGDLGNILVLVLYSKRKNRSTSGFFIFQLSVVDLMACTLLHPYVISKQFNNYKQKNVVLCKVFEFFIHANLAVSTGILFLVAIDRYIAICRPLKYLTYRRRRKHILMIIIAISVTVSLPILLMYGERTTSIEWGDRIVASSMCDFSDSFQNTNVMHIFGIFMFMLFLVVIFTMSVLYVKVAAKAFSRRNAIYPVPTRTCEKSNNSAGKENKINITPTVSLGKGDNNPQTVNGRKFKTSSSSAHEPKLTYVVQKVFDSLHHSKKLNVPEPDPISARPCSSSSCNTKATDEDGFNSNSKLFVKPQSKITSMFLVSSNQASKSVQKDTLRRVFSNPGTITRSSFPQNVKTAKLLFLVTAVFLLSWSPFWIHKILKMVYPDLFGNPTRVEIITERFFLHLFYLNNAVNPFIYTLIAKDFRKDTSKLFQQIKIFCRKQET